MGTPALHGRLGELRGAADQGDSLIGLAPAAYFSADGIVVSSASPQGMRVVVKGEPGARRQVLDVELAAVSQPYYSRPPRVVTEAGGRRPAPALPALGLPNGQSANGGGEDTL